MPRPLLTVLIAALVVGGLALGLFIAQGDRRMLDMAEEHLPDGAVPDEFSAEPTPQPTPEPTPTPTQPAWAHAPRVEPPLDPVEMYWGAHTADAPDVGALDDLEERVGSTPAILMWFVAWEDEPPFDVDAASDLADRGVVPMITWEPWDPAPDDPSHSPEEARDVAEQPDYRLQRIIEGEFDAYIESFAAEVADYGGPLLLRFAHEMDGFWYPWGGTVNDNEPADYVEAWRHLHGVFGDAGADNVTWVWSVNHLSVPNEPGNQPDAYWPGDRYVDWIGVSGFNFGDAAATPNWRSFDEIYADRLAQLAEFDTPIMLTEIASVEDGGDKAAWIADASAAMRRQEQIRSFVWFDRQVEDLKDWRLDSSDAVGEAFRETLDHGVLSAPSAMPPSTR